jgi:RNA polymerase sigma-70 factor, ECF subfamily
MSLAIDWFKAKQAEDPMQYLDDVYRYARSRLGLREDAEDVAIEVVQSLPNPCSRRDLRTYMIGMARRKVADRMRRRRPQHHSMREHEATASFDDQSDHAQMVESALSKISADHRELLTLKYVVGMTSREIGALLGKRADAVDSALQRARDSFSQEWSRLTSDEVNL